MSLNLEHNAHYLLACSYGPDSMALLDMLKKEGYNFSIAMVNYNLRKESTKERDDLIKYCEANNIRYHIKNVETPISGNIENTCRLLRYLFFKTLFEKEQYDALLVGHHLDDLLETYYLQKQRKNLVKCYGLQKNTTIFGLTIIRPLLDYTKDDLLRYCQKNNVPFAIDNTNLEDKYERNKIRHHVINKMSLNEKQELAKHIKNLNIELSSKLSYIASLDINDIDVISSLNDEDFNFAIFKLLEQKKLFHPVSQKLGKELCKIVLSKKANVEFKITKTISFVKSYKRCYFLASWEQNDFCYEVMNPTIIDNEYFYLDLTGDVSNRKVSKDTYPFIIRNAKPDDIYIVDGHAKTFRRLFIDWKVPLSVRKRYPVFVKNNHIFYAPRYQSDFVLDTNCNFYIK